MPSCVRDECEAAIINIAAPAVSKRGFYGVNLDRSARDPQFQKSSIYCRFSSKAELIAEIFSRFSDQIFWFLDRTQTQKLLRAIV